MQSPARRKSRGDLDSVGSGAGRSGSDPAFPSAKAACFVPVTLEQALEDSPEIRQQLQAQAVCSENAALLVKATLKRASSLRDALRTVDKERQALVASLRQLEAVFEGDTSAAWGFRSVCDTLDECNKLMAGEAQQLQQLLVDGLQSLAEEPGAAKRELKGLLRLRGAFESAADKAAASERKDVPPPKSDETAAQLASARTVFRRGQLEYVAWAAAGQQMLRARVARQALEWWMTRQAAARAVGATMDGALETAAAAMGRLEEEGRLQAVAAAAEAAQRQALESSDSFCGAAAVCGGQLQGWLWQRAPGKLGGWTRRFFRVADGQLRAAGEGEGGAAVPLVTARVRACAEPDRRHCFSVVGPSDELLLQVREEKAKQNKKCSDAVVRQAASPQEAALWQRALELESERLLGESGAERAAFSGGEQRAGGSGPLERLFAADPRNAACADCGAPGPEWAAINLGILCCIRCSGAHRALGVQISKVRDWWFPSVSPLLLNSQGAFVPAGLVERRGAGAHVCAGQREGLGRAVGGAAGRRHAAGSRRAARCA